MLNAVDGYEGDPDNDGNYTYAVGYNLANSEMGHLFYGELGNLGYYDTSGNIQSGYGLQNTGDFDNLIAFWYWSGTECGVISNNAWTFSMADGGQRNLYKPNSWLDGLAVRSGQVSTAAPIPEPATMLLFSTGLAGLAALKRKRKGNRV